MPQGDKSAYTSKQKRKAAHIEDGYEERGVSEGEAERRAWATVNKQDGGGRAKKSAPQKAVAKKTARKSPAKNTKTAKRAPAKRKTAKKSVKKTARKRA